MPSHKWNALPRYGIWLVWRLALSVSTFIQALPQARIPPVRNSSIMPESSTKHTKTRRGKMPSGTIISRIMTNPTETDFSPIFASEIAPHLDALEQARRHEVPRLRRRAAAFAALALAWLAALLIIGHPAPLDRQPRRWPPSACSSAFSFAHPPDATMPKRSAPSSCRRSAPSPEDGGTKGWRTATSSQKAKSG